MLRRHRHIGVTFGSRCPPCGGTRRPYTFDAGATPPPPRGSGRVVLAAVGVFGLGLSAYLFQPSRYRGAPTSVTTPLDADHFTPAKLTASVACGPDTKLLTLTLPPSALPAPDACGLPIWSVYIKDDDIQVERPYTPLEGIDARGQMVFWVKRYPKGEVGRWLHAKGVGETVELRGPLATWPWKEGEWDEVVMISGGTGITPFYQLLHHTLLRTPTAADGPRRRTRFTLLHSSRTPADLPPARLLAPLLAHADAHPDRFRMRLFVDAAAPPARAPPAGRALNLTVRRIDAPSIADALEQGRGRPPDSWWTWLFSRAPEHTEGAESERKVLFLVCGPEPMTAAIAGPFGRNLSQGPVGGILGAMGFGVDQVRKL